MGENAPKDPKGEGRVREVVFERKGGKEVVGSVWWEKDEGKSSGGDERGRGEVLEVLEQTSMRGGSVELVSSIMPVVLKL